MTVRAGALAMLIASGCSLFGQGQTPQQHFLDALNRGNSAEASQIWLAMTPQDRDKFRHGEGMTPSVPSDELTKILSEQGVDANEGPITIGPHTGATLLDLPSAAGSAPPSGDAH